MKINWKVRVNNQTWWITLIPAVLVLIAAVADLFGITLDLSVLGEKLVYAVKCLFLVLGILGIVVDPTTAGMSDSQQAMSYAQPKEAE